MLSYRKEIISTDLGIAQKPALKVFKRSIRQVLEIVVVQWGGQKEKGLDLG